MRWGSSPHTRTKKRSDRICAPLFYKTEYSEGRHIINWSVIGIYAFLFLMPLVVGGLLRLLLRKLPLGWVLTAIAAAAALVSWLIAWNPPYGGNEGFYFRAYMLTSFTVGSFITGGILLYRRKQN